MHKTREAIDAQQRATDSINVDALLLYQESIKRIEDLKAIIANEMVQVREHKDRFFRDNERYAMPDQFVLQNGRDFFNVVLHPNPEQKMIMDIKPVRVF